MPNQDIPNEAPPSYQQATGSSKPGQGASNRLNVPSGSSDNGIPTHHRRSMEDESRPLPKGWVRSFDPETHHQFFVDTRQDPPQSIWHHPYDDEDYLRTLSSEERERIEQESLGRGHPMSKADIMASHTDDEDDGDHHTGASSSSSSANQELPPRPGNKGKQPLGRKIKDKLTGTTHEQREAERKRREEEEKKIYEQHLKYRQAMARAMETGKPQLIGKDKQGKEVYIEPPSYAGGSGSYGGGYGYSPYGSGVYSSPNARYIRPGGSYGRPMGYGYGGGYGMPLALGGGLMGGLLLGDMMGGGMGMGGGFGGGGF